MYKCENGVAHESSNWCGLVYTPDEQKILSQYLLGLILCAQDILLTQACLDTLWALRSWSKDFKPNQFQLVYPLDSELRVAARQLLDRALKCHTPHSQAWCSASDCPSCCVEDLNNRFKD